MSTHGDSDRARHPARGSIHPRRVRALGGSRLQRFTGVIPCALGRVAVAGVRPPQSPRSARFGVGTGQRPSLGSTGSAVAPWSSWGVVGQNPQDARAVARGFVQPSEVLSGVSATSEGRMICLKTRHMRGFVRSVRDMSARNSLSLEARWSHVGLCTTTRTLLGASPLGGCHRSPRTERTEPFTLRKQKRFERPWHTGRFGDRTGEGRTEPQGAATARGGRAGGRGSAPTADQGLASPRWARESIRVRAARRGRGQPRRRGCRCG